MLRKLLSLDQSIRNLLLRRKSNRFWRMLMGQYLRKSSRFARWMYASRFCPTRTSANYVIARVLKPGCNFIDGGANIGQMTRIASVCVGPTGRVHAFEPSPEIFPELQAFLSSGFKNIAFNQLLLGETPGEMQFYLHENRVSSSVCCEYIPDGKTRSVTCQATTLDAYWEQCEGTQFDFIKLDLEGYEYPVLKGGKRMIEAVHPLIFTEIDNLHGRQSHFGYGIEDIFTFFENLSYDIYAIRTGGLLALKSHEDIVPETDNDLFFVHKESALYAEAMQLVEASVHPK